jgi:hypothetical protein
LDEVCSAYFRLSGAGKSSKNEQMFDTTWIAEGTFPELGDLALSMQLLFIKTALKMLSNQRLSDLAEVSHCLSSRALVQEPLLTLR